eukprot:140285-Pyramimonas_sp.AAC.1
MGWNGGSIFEQIGSGHGTHQVPLFEDSTWHDVIVEVTTSGNGASVILNFGNGYYYRTATINGYASPVGSQQLAFTARTG